MNLSIFLNKTGQTLKSNSPEILTALGVVGVATTSYLTAKASVAAMEIIRSNEADGVLVDRKQRIKERVKHTWKLYIPAAVSGAVTVACIVGASKANSKRTAAAVTAYSLTERAFAEYKEKVVETIGKGKEQKIRDEVAQSVVTQNPPGTNEVIVAGKGEVLCCELLTRRYLKSDMEALRKAQNDVNVKVVNSFSLYVTLDEFYDLIGLSHTSTSDKMGWHSNRLMELNFSTVLSEGGEPCLAFDYNYLDPI